MCQRKNFETGRILEPAASLKNALRNTYCTLVMESHRYGCHGQNKRFSSFYESSPANYSASKFRRAPLSRSRVVERAMAVCTRF